MQDHPVSVPAILDRRDPEWNECVAGNQIDPTVSVEVAKVAGRVIARHSPSREWLHESAAAFHLFAEDDERIEVHLAAEFLIVGTFGGRAPDGRDVLVAVVVEVGRHGTQMP